MEVMMATNTCYPFIFKKPGKTHAFDYYIFKAIKPVFVPLLIVNLWSSNKEKNPSKKFWI